MQQLDCDGCGVSYLEKEEAEEALLGHVLRHRWILQIRHQLNSLFQIARYSHM